MKNSTEKSKRLSEALRANLKRRKQENRALGRAAKLPSDAGQPEGGAPEAPSLRKRPLKPKKID